MKKLLPLLVTGLLALPMAALADAEEFYSPIPTSGSVSGFIDFEGSADGGYTRVDVRNTTSPAPQTLWGGQFQGYFSDVIGEVLEGQDPTSLFFRFFCIDLYQHTSDGATAYTASQYTNSNIQKLYDIAYPNEQLGDFFNGTKTSFGKFSGNGSGYSAQEYSTAFQLAVWELVYETDATHSLNTGNLRDELNSDARTIANGWLSQVDSYNGLGYQNWQLYGFASDTNQDFLAARFTTPEPGSMLLAGLGLVGLAMTSRRRRTKV